MKRSNPPSPKHGMPTARCYLEAVLLGGGGGLHDGKEKGNYYSTEPAPLQQALPTSYLSMSGDCLSLGLDGVIIGRRWLANVPPNVVEFFSTLNPNS